MVGTLGDILFTAMSGVARSPTTSAWGRDQSWCSWRGQESGAAPEVDGAEVTRSLVDGSPPLGD